VVALTEVRGNVADLAEVCQAWGSALGRLHTTAVRSTRAGGSGRPPRAWPWVLDEGALARFTCRGPGAVRFGGILPSLEAGPLRIAATEVAERWTAQHWVHGDLRPDQVLVSGSAVRLVGLGSAGLGDPAWDLAAAYDGLQTLSDGWALPPRLAVDYFLQGYRHAGGPARLYPALQAVHALVAAWEQAESGAGAETVAAWVAQARRFAGRATSVAA
jgi:aminoglycoside phosphotransferase (APT) family kinase protein